VSRENAAPGLLEDIRSTEREGRTKKKQKTPFKKNKFKYDEETKQESKK